MAKTKTSSKKSAKSHRGAKVVAIVVAIIVLALGGLATWFFAYYNNPEKVAFDAMNQLFSADNVGFEGDFSLQLSDSEQENSPVSMILLSFDSSSSQLPASNTATLGIYFNREIVQGEPQVVLKLSNVIMKNGVLYFQIVGVMDSLESFSLKSSEWAEVENIIPFLETVDNEWWQIDVNNIVSELELPASQKDTVTGVYSCIVEAMNRNNSKELAELYKKNRFVVVTPSKYLSPEGYSVGTEAESWHNAYSVSLDRYKLADFLNAIPETAAANEFYACFNAIENDSATVPLAIDASDFDEIFAEDLNLPDDLRIFMEVSTFGHKLRSVYAYQNTDDYHADGAVLIKYQDVDVSAPTEYRPITDLIEEFIELLEEM